MDNIITTCENCGEVYSANVLNCDNSLVFCKSCQTPKFLVENKNSVFYQLSLNRQRTIPVKKSQEVLDDVYR